MLIVCVHVSRFLADVTAKENRKEFKQLTLFQITIIIKSNLAPTGNFIFICAIKIYDKRLEITTSFHSLFFSICIHTINISIVLYGDN